MISARQCHELLAEKQSSDIDYLEAIRQRDEAIRQRDEIKANAHAVIKAANEACDVDIERLELQIYELKKALSHYANAQFVPLPQVAQRVLAKYK